MTVTQDNPLESVLAEVSKAMSAGLPYAALMIALSIPDICVTLENSAKSANMESYARWVQTYLHNGLDTPTNKLLYKLRCGVFHNGILSHKDMQYLQCSRVVFTVPGSPMQIDGMTLNGAVCWSAQGFCDRMIAAARKWYAEKAGQPGVEENLDNLIRIRGSGLSPYVVGAPLLA